MRYHHVEEHLSHNKCCFCVSVNNMIWALEDWFYQNEHLANPCNLRCHNTRTNYIIRVYDLEKPIEGLFHKQHFYESVKPFLEQHPIWVCDLRWGNSRCNFPSSISFWRLDNFLCCFYSLRLLTQSAKPLLELLQQCSTTKQRERMWFF